MYEKLGSGCFGSVYRVQHKLDKKYYAIKLVELTEEHAVQLREVNKLAIIQNAREKNIVIYLTAWLEDQVSSSDILKKSRQVRDKDTQETKVDLSTVVHTPSETGCMPVHNVLLENENIATLRELDGNISENLTEKYVLFIQMNLCTMALKTWLNDGRNLLIIEGNSKLSEAHTKILQKDWILHEKGTCDQLFTYVNGDGTNKLLEGIVCGLSYIHSLKIAHGDLHLDNILIDIHDGRVTPRICDFGLAKSLSFTSNDQPETSYRWDQNKYSFCQDSKDDMQRLAKIILKLYNPSTSDELKAELYRKQWNVELVCPALFMHWPIQSEWMQRLMSEDYMKRPTASELLCIGYEDKIFEVARGNELWIKLVHQEAIQDKRADEEHKRADEKQKRTDEENSKLRERNAYLESQLSKQSK